MVWLDPQELRSMGSTLVGKPVQTQQAAAEQPIAPQTPGEPRQLTPETKASSAPTWKEMLEKATALSASQHSGKPDFNRFCQPEFKTCAITLSFTLRNGREGFLKVVEDLDGKVIRRESCEFNEFGDVRSCLNWTDGTTHRDMKNVKGEWYKVSD
jgi:hypothetical protein